MLSTNAMKTNPWLADQPVGQLVRIAGFTLPESVRLRLMEMGLTEGAVCRVVRYAPLGDPMEIEVRGYFLSLGKADAGGIRVISVD
jgi:ferrous iron transport protein A